MKIAVTGATGRLGPHIVRALEESGHEVVAIARSTGVDVITGEGLDEALTGVEAIVDAATDPTGDTDKATAFFTTSAANLQAAGERAGVKRIVLVSIIGCDRYAGGFLSAKFKHEQALLAGPLPVRILRAAQFHEFVETLVQWSTRDGVAQLPEMRTQLVACAAVGEELARLALADEDGSPVAEIAGPREDTLVGAARLLVERRGEGIRVQPVAHDPGDPDDVLNASGGLLPGPDAILAGPTYEEWLDAAAVLR